MMSRKTKGFFEKVYDIVAKIPPGKVLTYGEIAMMLGNPRASRVVGYAMNSAPPERNLPCHRVVYKDGYLVGGDVFGGKKNHRRILEEEGVTFLKNGCIDMEKHSY